MVCMLFTFAVIAVGWFGEEDDGMLQIVAKDSAIRQHLSFPPKLVDSDEVGSGGLVEAIPANEVGNAANTELGQNHGPYVMSLEMAENIDEMDIVNGSVSTSLTLDEQQQILNEHNKYRCMHGAGNLTWNMALASSAAQWAQKCCHSGCEHSASYKMNPPQGENCQGGIDSIAEVVRHWYNEVKDCGKFPGCKIFPTDKKQKQVGHFTAMIWKGTTVLGCARNPTGWHGFGPVYVCRYALNPPNIGFNSQFGRAFKANVFEQIKQESECDGATSSASATTTTTAETTTIATTTTSLTTGTTSVVYVFQDAGKSECPEGFSKVLNKDECEEIAVARSQRFKDSIQNPTLRPSGCFQAASGKTLGEFKFNDPEVSLPGVGHYKAALVCRKVSAR